MNNRLKALAAIITLLLPVFASAEDISLSKAQGVAEKFFIKSGVATRGSSHLTLVNKDEVAQTRSASDAYFYIFNRAEGGFVIISALDAACPVLGYSFEGSFSITRILLSRVSTCCSASAKKSLRSSSLLASR